MAVAVQPPTGGAQKKDPLDIIIKGLHVAGQVYGIREASLKADLLASETAKQNQEAEILKTKALAASKNEQENKNPMSAQSLAAKAFFKDVTGREADPNATYDSLSGVIDVKKLAEVKASKMYGSKEKDPITKALEAERLAKMTEEKRAKEEKAAFEKTTEGKIAKLNSSDKQRLDNVRMAYDSVNNMAKALASGENTFSLVGDNPYTLSVSKFEEALGRMQSGGAISKDEEIRFKKMAPTVFDNPQIRQAKINELQKEFGARFKTLGFKPQDLGVEELDISQAIPKSRFFSTGDVKSKGELGVSEKEQDDLAKRASEILLKRKGIGSTIPSGKPGGG